VDASTETARAAAMTEDEKQALAIFEMICVTSEDRPLWGNSVEQLMREMSDWKAKNPALTALRNARPGVQSAFLDQSFEWLRAETKADRNIRVCHTLPEAIQIALELAPKPFPPELVLKLLRQFRAEFSMARSYFPFGRFLSLLVRDQVTDEIRDELRRLHLQFAPSPTGKIDKHSEQTRTLIAELMWEEGEKQLDSGRGPWSQIVFDEVKQRDEITCAGWEGLLEHCRALEQAAPGAKWKKGVRDMMAALGEADAVPTILRWLALGPTPGQPKESRSPIEDSAYQKGALWCLSFSKDRKVAIAIADFVIACLRKIPMMGAVSQKVGFAGVQVLGSMECSEAVSQLARLRTKVKYSVARRLIEKSLRQAAERNGLTVDEIEDISVGRYGLDARGVTEIAIGDAKAIVSLCEEGRVALTWRNADGKLVKSAPARIKKAFVQEVRSVSSLAKESEQALLAQRFRLESFFMTTRVIPVRHWRDYFIDHPLLGFVGRRLIWAFSNDQGWERNGLWFNGDLCDATGEQFDLAAANKVRLWHPLSSDAAEVQRWRERVFTTGIRQPFRQAFREFYQVSDDERQTRMYSNRFAGVILRQHQLASLCRTRGWDYRLQGTDFDGYNVPTKKLSPRNMQVELHVDLPPDRDRSLRESGLAEMSGTGINLFITSDQVRFYRDRQEVAVDEIPAVLYSEVMRDVDLFTGVCAVGDDELWSDQGERGTGLFRTRFEMNELTEVIALRAEILSRVLPHTPIADRCKIEKTHLEVRGQLGTYRIQFGWAATALVTGSEIRWLRIPQQILDAVAVDLTAIPIELDYRTEMVLRKAYILADDWRIDSPELVRQLMPE
jgi:hypothetical protein